MDGAEPFARRGRRPAAVTIRGVDPDLATSSVGHRSTLLQGPIFILRIIRGSATPLASISMVLAMAGLFGVFARRPAAHAEIGIRIALGADRGRIFRLLSSTDAPVAKGIALGLFIGVGGVSPSGPGS